MYIEPNSVIYILKGVPLDTTYDHTIWFPNATSQRDYFSGLAKFRLVSQSYQRVNSGMMKVEIKSEDLYDCNYLMFQNTAFGNKWFYAFITSVEYINNITSQITFNVDVMQTWYFDYTLEQSFVEREHTISDNIGEHILNEGFDAGEYIVNQTIQHKPAMQYCILASNGPQGQNADAYVDSGGYPVALWFRTYINAQPFIDTINEFTQYGQQGAIISLFISVGTISDPSIVPPSRGNTLDGYTPKNNKMLTYPYVKCNVVNSDGVHADFKYELFANTPQFKIVAKHYPNAAQIIYPLYYAGVDENVVMGLATKNFPTVATASDSFQAWIAQITSAGAFPQIKESVGRVTSMLGANDEVANVVGGLAGAGATTFATGMNTGIAQSALTGKKSKRLENTAYAIANTVNSAITALATPDAVVGSPSNNPLLTALGRVGIIDLRKETIRAEYAKSIDGYFSKFGYSVNQFKVPSVKNRPHWTYLKTVSCTIRGSCPADDEASICAIYDHGITFWVNGDEVGNYSLDNRPTNGGE